MKAIICGALLALTITIANAAEDINSANFMLPYCKMTSKEAAADTTNAIGHAHCYGTIYGVSQMLILLEHSQHPDPIVCTTVPPSATPEQLVNIVIKYAEVHPEMTHHPFVALAFVAMREAWPCK
jgi:hypothetical protein